MSISVRLSEFAVMVRCWHTVDPQVSVHLAGFGKLGTSSRAQWVLLIY